MQRQSLYDSHCIHMIAEYMDARNHSADLLCVSFYDMGAQAYQLHPCDVEEYIRSHFKKSPHGAAVDIVDCLRNVLTSSRTRGLSMDAVTLVHLYAIVAQVVEE